VISKCPSRAKEGLSTETEVRGGNWQIYWLNFQQAFHELQYNKYKLHTDSGHTNLHMMMCNEYILNFKEIKFCKMSHLVIFESAWCLILTGILSLLNNTWKSVNMEIWTHEAANFRNQETTIPGNDVPASQDETSVFVLGIILSFGCKVKP
jgi:hypothetical protein